MNLLSVSEKLLRSNADRNTIRLEATRCLHSQDRFADCQVCMAVCPEEAILPGNPPTLDESKCTNCLACLTACPVDAFEGEDAVPALLNWVPALQGRKVELLCDRHPKPGSGISSDHIGLEIQGCLAGIGTGGLVTLALVGFKELVLRLDGCEDCRWQTLRGHVLTLLGTANHIISYWNPDKRIMIRDERPQKDRERPLQQANASPLSRRDLFRKVKDHSRESMGELIEDNRGEPKRPARDNIRLQRVLNSLPAGTDDNRLIPTHLSLAALSVNEKCDACGACATICPTGALDFFENRDEMKFKLILNPLACVGCSACAHCCPADAVEIEQNPPFSQLFNAVQPASLMVGNLKSCRKCGALFAQHSDSPYCRICNARSLSPFGTLTTKG